MNRNVNPGDIIEVQEMCEKYRLLVREIITLNREAEQLAESDKYSESIEKYTMILKLLQLAVDLSDEISMCALNNEDDIMNRLFCKKMDMQCRSFKGKISRVKKIIRELQLMQERENRYLFETEIDDVQVANRMGKRVANFDSMRSDFTQNFQRGAPEDERMMSMLISEVPDENQALREALTEMKERYGLLMNHCKKLHGECQIALSNENIKEENNDEEDKKEKADKKDKEDEKEEKKNKNKFKVSVKVSSEDDDDEDEDENEDEDEDKKDKKKDKKKKEKEKEKKEEKDKEEKDKENKNKRRNTATRREFLSLPGGSRKREGNLLNDDDLNAIDRLFGL